MQLISLVNPGANSVDLVRDIAEVLEAPIQRIPRSESSACRCSVALSNATNGAFFGPGQL